MRRFDSTLSLWLPALVVGAAFVASRLLAHWAGIRFDTSTLGWDWHYPDLGLLRQDLGTTLLNWHATPPVFVLFLGWGLRQGGSALFGPAFLVLGLMLAASLYGLLRRVGLAAWPAAGLAALFTVSPACLLYEQWFSYCYPVTALLAAGAFALHEWLATGAGRWAWLCAGCLAAVALTMAMFHLAWLVMVAVLALRAARGLGIRGGRAPFGFAGALVAAWYVKNLLLFGVFGASTWLGMNLARTTIFQMPAAVREAHVKAGRLPPIARLGPFQAVGTYRGLYPATPARGLAVLDAPTRAGGPINFNHRDYVPISRAYLGASLQAVRLEPLAYVKSVVLATLIYVRLADDNGFLHPNRFVARPYPEAFGLVANGCLAPLFPTIPTPAEIGSGRARPELFLAAFLKPVAWWLVAAIPLLLAWGWRAGSGGQPLAVLLRFLVLTVAYVAVVGNLIEQGENNRFRFATDPLLLTLFGAWLACRFPALASREGLAPAYSSARAACTAKATDSPPPGRAW